MYVEENPERNHISGGDKYFLSRSTNIKSLRDLFLFKGWRFHSYGVVNWPGMLFYRHWIPPGFKFEDLIGEIL